MGTGEAMRIPGAIAAVPSGAAVVAVAAGIAAGYLRSHLPETLLALSLRG
jgi:hypothetical protein